MDSTTMSGITSPVAGMPAADAMPRLASAWMRETMDFLAERLRADARTLQEAGCCDSLSDLTEVQTRWVTEATQAYSAVTLRLMDSFVRLGAPPPAKQEAAAPEAAPRRRPREAEAA